MMTDEMTSIRQLVLDTWPHTTTWPTGTWDRWWEELQDYPYPLVEYVVRASTSRQFPPSWADVGDVCAEHALRRARQAALRAGVDEW
jgi:hypothetical protein